jgi:glycosyltransferase involved in cell wall biosynthesis
MMLGADLICLSHLRWNFVFQRPNHLMSECSRERRVFFVEEPVFSDSPAVDTTEAGDTIEAGRIAPRAKLEIREVQPQLHTVIPRLATGDDPIITQRQLLEELCERYRIAAPTVWFYTPMALKFARDLRAAVRVYDCMDELSAFRGAPRELQGLERELFERADLVFTGGQSLYESKRGLHPSVHLFPSSVDAEHFRKARGPLPDPADQRAIKGPRIGFFGVIDERLDLELLERIARECPDWSLVILGPVVKIDPSSLPRLPNIHYLGQKRYEELPAYLANWDVAIMPFALNESTRFISPTKTLEYLAGGKPVVSTMIRDVVTPYADSGLVQVAESDNFVAAVGRALAGDALPKLAEVDAFLERTSWRQTWGQMSALITSAHQAKESRVA